jgi:thiamine-phosphate pyrophosphorylase
MAASSEPERPRATFRLYAITDRRLAPDGDLPALVERALAEVPAGRMAVQLREKDLNALELCRMAERIRQVTEAAGAPLLINDRADVALAIGADGVHLPGGGLSPTAVRQLWPDALIGVSTHALPEVQQAGAAGADFVVFGPVYPTPSKAPFGDPLGPDALARAAGAAALPVLAIGGVTPSRAPEVRRAGAAGAAAISAIFAHTDPGRAAADFLMALETELA